MKFGILIITMCLSVLELDARCCIPKPINCYNCDSEYDVRCRDPFNWSSPEIHPPYISCNGCCIKWVLNSKTPKEIVRRSCITQYQVNLFMVDRGCMQERSKTGHLCFCEEDLCNRCSTKVPNIVLLVFITLFYIIK
ncbi:protein quiver-like [Photinus pyralis]|uniref:protein quiver-like n=1 Tax=Photinus pyralis TaxID=7054 RepID=UPI001266F0B8|nr:protein quiver-like [Photinus pyralis]